MPAARLASMKKYSSLSSIVAPTHPSLLFVHRATAAILSRSLSTAHSVPPFSTDYSRQLLERRLKVTSPNLALLYSQVLNQKIRMRARED